MPTIIQLPLLPQVSGSDNLAIYSSANGDARRIPASALLDYFEENYTPQLIAPTVNTNVYYPATGFSIAVTTPPEQDQWIILQPAGTLATGTIVLPLNTDTPDGTEVFINTTQQITSFALSLNGASAAYGEPATLAAEDHFRLRFHATLNSWYRVG